MKRLVSVVLLLALLAASMCACGKKKGSVDTLSGEITVSDGKYNISFTLQNNTGETVSELSALIRAFSSDGKQSDEKNVTYPIEVENGQRATFSFSTEKECEIAKAVSCTYKNAQGETVSAELSQEITAQLRSETAEKPVTRETVANDIIREINNQFLKKGTPSTGSYDPDRKQLMIISRYSELYDDCLIAYSQDPTVWNSMTDGIVSMSLYCLEKLEDNGFTDVDVGVAIASLDDEIMFSATNGELTNYLAEN